MKTREELIHLADTNLPELSLLFAQRVAKKEIHNSIVGPEIYESEWISLPDYHNDRTATEVAIEKAGLGFVSAVLADGRRNARIGHVFVESKPGWPPCVPLMICALEVMQ